MDRRAVLAAPRTFPILMAPAGDALRTGLVGNLARPGGNVTGFSLAFIEFAAKTVALLRETVPHVKRIAWVVYREDPLHRGFLDELESAARRIGLQFCLVFNLKTAKALGLTIPPSLLLRADQVIE